MKRSASPVVVTGTDTEVGKTLVAAGLARALVDAGLKVLALKPVESGVSEDAAEPTDASLLAKAARQKHPNRALVRLKAPLAPPLAADAENVSLDMGEWCGWIEGCATGNEGGGFDVVLVEGAGGVLSPLTWKESTRDLAVRLDASVLVVAPDRLGTLSHTLAALEVLRAAGLTVLGVVFSAPEAPDSSTGGNAATLARFAELSRVATLPRVGSFAEAATYLEPVADWLVSSGST